MTNLLNKGLREPDPNYYWFYSFWDEDYDFDTLLDDDCQVTGTHILWGNWSLRDRYSSILAMNELRNTNQLS